MKIKLKVKLMKKCKKISYNTGDPVPFDKKFLYGIIIQEDDNFLTFKTGSGKEYRIAKSTILLIEDSNKDFMEE